MANYCFKFCIIYYCCQCIVELFSLKGTNGWHITKYCCYWVSNIVQGKTFRGCGVSFNCKASCKLLHCLSVKQVYKHVYATRKAFPQITIFHSKRYICSCDLSLLLTMYSVGNYIFPVIYWLSMHYLYILLWSDHWSYEVISMM